MRVFVAGATGALGQQLVPQLVERGHDVVGMTRSNSKQDLVRSLGARPVVADALDADAVARAVAAAEPEVIVHELTALSGEMSLRETRHPERAPMTVMTNRLRTEGTDNLLAAGRAAGARRVVAQSFGAFRWARTGGPVLTEADPLDPEPPGALRPVVEALLHLERAVTTIDWGEGLALRYGGFYGPGTSLSADPDAVMAAPIRKRRFPSRRRRRRRLVAYPHRGRGDGDRHRGRARRAGCVLRRRRRARDGAGVVARGRETRWMRSRRGVSHAGSGDWQAGRWRRP